MGATVVDGFAQQCKTGNVISKYIYILGSSGFIGQRIYDKFLETDLNNVLGYSSSECDLLSPKSIYNALSKITKNDVIVLVSCITRLKENSYESMLKNIQMAENLGRFIGNHPVSQAFFLSTVDVYGVLPDDVLISEDLMPNPSDYYSISKIASEYLLRKTFSKLGIPLTIFRLTGIYGQGDEGKSTINVLVENAQNNRKITVFGDGLNKRDFVYVDDIFKITCEAIRLKTDITINVATGNSYSIVEIANMIAREIGDDVKIEFCDPISSNEPRINYMNYDIGSIQSIFPKIKLTDLSQGISLYISNKHIN